MNTNRSVIPHPDGSVSWDDGTGRVSADEIARRKARTEARIANRNPPTIEGTVFLARLTDAEYLSVMARAQAQAQLGDATMARWIEDVRATNRVVLNSDAAQAAKAALIADGDLSQGRADIVFAPPK